MKKDHFEVLLEDIDDKFQMLLEIAESLVPLPARVERINQRLQKMESDIAVFKSVLKEHNSEILGHDKRLAMLEAKQSGY